MLLYGVNAPPASAKEQPFLSVPRGDLTGGKLRDKSREDPAQATRIGPSITESWL